MGILYVETIDENLVYHGVNEPPNDFNGCWYFKAENGNRSVWISHGVVLSLEFEDGDPEVTEVASLTFDIDFSAAGQATEELDKLKDAVDAMTEAYVRLNEAQNGPVECHGTIDATDRLIKELLAGVGK